MSAAPYLIAPASANESLKIEPSLPAEWPADLQANCGIALEAQT